MTRPLAPKGGNDDVMTPPALCEAIVQHFRPSGSICEPCYGTGNFLRAFPGNSTVFGFEIDDAKRLSTAHGSDFLNYKRGPGEYRFDWIVTNPPWSKFRAFLGQSMELSDNIVFLCLINALFMKARLADMRSAGFGVAEVLQVVQPPKPWPQTGFALGACWIRRGWTGSTSFTHASELGGKAKN